MKKAVLILVLFSIISACKKGDNDPFLSLKSRKNRITGKWETVTSETKTIDVNFSQNNAWDYYLETTEIFDGDINNITIFHYEDSSGTQQTGITEVLNENYTESFEFKKDGTYIYKKIVTDEYTITIEESGIWCFLPKSKAKNLKKKEAVQLQTTKMSKINSFGMVEETTSDDWNTNFKIFVLDKLKSDEIIMIYESNYSSSYEKLDIKSTIKLEKQ